MWSIGCIFAELLDHSPLFTGSSDFDQLARIARFVGAPTADDRWFPKVPEFARLTLNDERKVDISEYLEHRLH